MDASKANPTNNAHVTVSAILVTLQLLTGGAALGDLIGVQLAGFFVLTVGAVQAGWAYFLANATVPSANVAAVKVDGAVLAGPAAPEPTGVPVFVERDLNQT